MSELRWTAERPKVDGLYWVRGGAGLRIPTQAVFVAVLGPDDLRWGRTAEERRTPFFRLDDKEFAGPIPEPLEPRGDWTKAVGACPDLTWDGPGGEPGVERDPGAG